MINYIFSSKMVLDRRFDQSFPFYLFPFMKGREKITQFSKGWIGSFTTSDLTRSTFFLLLMALFWKAFVVDKKIPRVLKFFDEKEEKIFLTKTKISVCKLCLTRQQHRRDVLLEMQFAYKNIEKFFELFEWGKKP